MDAFLGGSILGGMQVKFRIPRGWKGPVWARLPPPESTLLDVPGDLLFEWGQRGLIHMIMIRRQPREVYLIFMPTLYEHLQSIPAEGSLQEVVK
jgi:hypothetical protein